MSSSQRITPETVNIARGGDLLAAELLRARVVRGQDSLLRQSQVSPFLLRVEELGDAEVEQLHLAFRGHEDVGRLEIAMNDEVLVGVSDSGADHAEELETFFSSLGDDARSRS